MTVRVRIPGDIDIAIRFFGRFTWKDLLRILVPTLGLAMLTPVAAVAGLVIGVALYVVRPHGSALDSHAIHAARYTLNQAIGVNTLPEVDETGSGHITTDNGTAVTGVTVSTTNLDLKTENEQQALLDTYRGLLERIRFPVQVVSRQISIANGQKTTHAMLVRVDASHDNPVQEAERRIGIVQDALTGGDLVADRLSGNALQQLAGVYDGETDYRHIYTGRDHVRIAAITEHPSEVDLGWVRRVLRVDGKVDLHQIIHPRDPRTTEKQLKREKESLTAEIESLLAGGFLGTNRLEARLADTEWMLDLLARREDAPVDYAAYVVVRGRTPEECDDLFDRVTAVLRAETREPVFRMDHAQHTVSPLTRDALEETLLMPARSAAAGFPFCTQNLQQSDGVPIGIDSRDRTPVEVNRWDWKAPHSVTMGETGSGKTFLQSLELLRTADQQQDVRIAIVDPKPDYRSVVSALDGQTYVVDAPVSDADLELCDVTSFEPDPGVDDETALLVDVVGWLYEQTTADDRKTLVVVDEAHNLLEDEKGAAVLSKFIREARSSNTAVSLLSQTVHEFLKSEVGKTILANAEAKLFMQHDDVPVEAADQFRLSQGEMGRVPMLKTGTHADYSEALIRIGTGVKTTVEVQTTRKEREVIEGETPDVRIVDHVSDHRSDDAERERDGEEDEDADQPGHEEPGRADHHDELRRLEEQIEARQQELQELDEQLRHRENTDTNTIRLEQMLPTLPGVGWGMKPVRGHGQLPEAEQQVAATYTSPDGRYTVTIARYIPHQHRHIVNTEALDTDQFQLWAPINNTIIAVTIHDGRIPEAARLIGESPVIDGDTEVKVVDDE